LASSPSQSAQKAGKEKSALSVRKEWVVQGLGPTLAGVIDPPPDRPREILLTTLSNVNSGEGERVGTDTFHLGRPTRANEKEKNMV